MPPSSAFPGSPATRSSTVTECGLDALNHRSRAPYRQSNRLPYQIERTILGIKREHPSWGALKIRDKLARQYPMVKTPAISTVHAVLDRNGLVKRRKRRRYKARGTPLSAAHEPNGLWCADFKGEFMLGNRQYCYPLTITDYRSRYLLACDGLSSTRSDFAFHRVRARLQGLRPGRDQSLTARTEYLAHVRGDYVHSGVFSDRHS